MKETVKQRLILFYETKGLSKKAFERMCGLSNGYMDKLRNCPSPQKLESIYLKFPDLNRVWLLTGEGDMLSPNDGHVATVGGDGTAVAGNSIHVEVPDIISRALQEISAQRVLTERSQSQVEKAQEQLDKAFDQVAIAQEQINRLITLLEKQHQ